MKPMTTALIALALLPSSACFNRPNPRLAEMTRTQGDSEETTKFDYDDEGHPVEIENDTGNTTNTLELEWEDGLLVKLTRVIAPDVGDESKVKGELKYEDGRAVSASFEGDSGTVDAELEYDDSGRFAELKVTQKDEDGELESKSTATFEYTDAGEIETFETVAERFLLGESQGKDKTTIELSWDDGELTSLEIDAETSGIEGDLEYDDAGRVAGVESDSRATINGVTFRGEANTEYEYDEDTGLLTQHTTKPDEGDDTETELEYDDGEANGIDITPGNLALIGVFDLKGTVHATPDVKLFAPRLLGASW